MKKLLTCYLILFVTYGYAQSPQSFKYQAVLRDNGGLPLIEKNITIKISILQGSLNGLSVYSEVHQAKTSPVGVVNLEIGKGLQNIGNFTTISWGTNTHFVKIEMDPLGGSNFEQVGISQLLSVPYALYAEKSGDEKWGKVNSDIHYLQGNVGIGTNSPLAKLEIFGGNSLNLLDLKNENNSLGINAYVSSNTDFHGSAYVGRRSRGTSGLPQPVQFNDRITGLYGSIYADGAYQNSSAIQMYVGTNPGSGSYPSNIRFETTEPNQIIRSERMRITESGNVGIGTITPLYKLDVNGVINATEFLQNGVPVIPQWTSNGNNISYNLGYVGIGTNNPVVKFEIDGGQDLNLFNLKTNNNSLGINAYVSSDTDFHGSAIIGRRSRGTNTSPQPVVFNDRITGLYGSIFVDGAYQNSSSIQMYVGNNAGPGSYPSNIRFETTSSNESFRTERLRISETGNIIVKTGDVSMESIGAGVIMKSPNGNCWRMTISDSGSPIFTSVTCPQ
jgi:hypothetical protein